MGWVRSIKGIKIEHSLYYYKLKGGCTFGGKCLGKCLIFQVQCTMCDTIYIGITIQPPKKKMDHNFHDNPKLLKTGKKLDSFMTHYEP